MTNNIEINPDTKVYELLEKYPALEDELISISEVFVKIKNPVLRKTIAKVTSLRQAARIGNVSVSELVNRLRKKAGLDEVISESDEPKENEKPDWLDESKIKISYNASEDIENGRHPLDKVLKEINGLSKGDIYLLQTPFMPAPLIDIMISKGFKCYTVKSENLFNNYIFSK
jgi:hypothetical protein